MAATVRHPGFKSHIYRFFPFLLSLQAGWVPMKLQSVILLLQYCFHVLLGGIRKLIDYN